MFRGGMWLSLLFLGLLCVPCIAGTDESVVAREETVEEMIHFEKSALDEAKAGSANLEPTEGKETGKDIAEDEVRSISTLPDSNEEVELATVSSTATGTEQTAPASLQDHISHNLARVKGHKLCHWSWKQKRCAPENLCTYKYQFLDATLSESCRLKDFKTHRSVFATSDIEVKPSYAIAGATGLFASDLLAIRFTDWLKKFPLLFNVMQGFILFVSGDTLFQVLEQGWAPKVGLKLWRMTRSGLIGALNNGFIHYLFYKWIDRRFPYHIFSPKTWGPPEGSKHKLAVGFTKWALEWPTIGVYKIISMYVLTAALSGSMSTVMDRIRDSFFLTWLRSLQVWPIYDTVLYAYVPTVLRPLFNSFMSILWGGYLSHVSQPHEEEKTADDDNPDAPE